MFSLKMGRNGVLILLFVFILLGAEDVLIWVNSGIVPGVEFFIAMLLILVVFAIAIRQAIAHPPPSRTQP